MRTFAYDAQLAAIPDVVADLVGRLEGPALDPGRPILFSGIGTSLHAARVAVDWLDRLTDRQVRATAVDAHDLGVGLTPLTREDQVVVISHRGRKRFPTAALERARSLGCTSVAVVGRAAPEQPASVTIRTCADETAGTFSVSYQGSLIALAKIVAATCPEAAQAFAASLKDLPSALRGTLHRPVSAELVERLCDHTPLLISGFGPDLITAHEAALKIKEGAWLWTEAMSPEFALHGTPASFGPAMGAIVIMPDLDDGGRSRQLVEVLRDLRLGVVATCGTGDADLAFAAPPHPLLRPFLAVLPFHQLTAQLARRRGTDPDTLHGYREPWKTVLGRVAL
jgi:glucosamine--fructose-6-phosphate aminotransferase (isomerizing)